MASDQERELRLKQLELKKLRAERAAAEQGAEIPTAITASVQPQAEATAPALTSGAAVRPAGFMGGMGGEGVGYTNRTVNTTQAGREGFDQGVREGMSFGVKTVLPTAASFMLPPVGSLLGALRMAGVFGAGEAAGQMVEGENPLERKNLGRTAAAAVTGATPARLGKLSLEAAPANSFLRVVAQGLKPAGVNAASTVAGAAAERVIANPEEISLATLRKDLESAPTPALVGFGLGVLGSKVGGKVQGLREEIEPARQRARDVGISDENITLGMIKPGEAAGEIARAQQNKDLGFKTLAAYTQIKDKFQSFLSNIDTRNPTIAKQLQPIISAADEADGRYQLALQAKETAMRDFDRATADMSQLSDAQNEAIAKASADMLNSVGEEARRAFEVDAAVGQFVSQSARSNLTKQVLDESNRVASKIGGALYDAVGIDKTRKIFPKQALYDAAEAALGDQARDMDGEHVLKAIKAYGARDANAPKTPPILDANGRPYPTKLGGEDALTINDFKTLRKRLSDGLMSEDGQRVNNVERLAGIAYKAMSEAGRDYIRMTGGDDALARWDEARSYWSTLSQAREQPLGRALLSEKPIADSTFESIGKAIAKGQLDEINSVKNFAAAIQQRNPAVATKVMQTVAASTANALRVEYRGEPQKLMAHLAKMADFEDIPFPFDQMGFGKRESVKQLNTIFKSYKPGEVTDRVVNDFLNNPAIQQVVREGGSDAAKVLKDAVSAEVFRDKMKARVALQFAGEMGKAQQAENKARDFLRTSGLNAEAAKKVVDEVKADPVLSAFSGKGKYTLTNALKDGGGSGSITEFFDSMPLEDRPKLMQVLRQKDAQMADVVEQRLIQNELYRLYQTDTKTPNLKDAGETATNTQKLNIGKTRDFFREVPSGMADTRNPRLQFLEGVVRPEVLKRYKDFARSLDAFDDQVREGKAVSPRHFETMMDALSIGAFARGSNTTTATTRYFILDKVRDWYLRGRHQILSAILTDPETAKAFYSGGETFSGLGKLPAQKAYLLANNTALMDEIEAERELARSKSGRQ